MYLFFFLTLFSAIIAHARQGTFLPPPGWEVAQSKSSSPYVKMGFIGKGSTEFRPTINLATEKTADVSLKEYVKTVKKLQLADPTVKWRDLGDFPMRGGMGRLTEMSSDSPWGETKILQAFLMADGSVYILTSSVLKKDFPKLQAEILQSFRSLTLWDDLWSPIEDPKKREEFQNLFASLGQSEEKREEQWEQLQAQVQTFSQLGPCWQLLALQEGYAKIYHVQSAME